MPNLTYTNPQELRQQLLNVLTAAPSVLGQFGGGLPAIWVWPPEPPGEVTGIRCLIQRTPVGSTLPSSSTQFQRDELYKVILTNYDPSSKDMAIAKLRIETNFLLSPDRTRQPAYLEPTTITLEECQFWLWRPCFVDSRRVS